MNARLTISRVDLVALTQATIRRIREDGVEVPTSLVRRLMRVARTTEKIAIEEWYDDQTGCGCLIGSIYPEYLDDEGDFDEERLTEPEEKIGHEFMYVLEEHGYDSWHTLDVVD